MGRPLINKSSARPNSLHRPHQLGGGVSLNHQSSCILHLARFTVLLQLAVVEVVTVTVTWGAPAPARPLLGGCLLLSSSPLLYIRSLKS